MAPARNRVLYGGRASTKSWDAAGFATFLTSNYKLRVLCVRQFQNKIEESVYTLLKAQISRFGLSSQFRILDNKIIGRETESEFLFYGLWRSIDEIKSLEGIDILWIDDVVVDTERLVVPHPHLHERAFAVRPLLDVAPSARSPRTNTRYADLLLSDDGISVTDLDLALAGA